MTAPFTWEAGTSRVVLAPGGLSRVGGEIERAGGRRVLLIGSGASTRPAVERVRAALGPRVVAVIERAAQHIPAATAEAAAARARATAADMVLTLGGGSATGLGKAVAMSCHIPLIAVPTTYAGSEMTPVWGRTSSGRKETGCSLEALPRAVIYDPELCAGMPARLAAASGMNALAHCVEAFWAGGANPITDVIAKAGARRLLAGLPRVVADPHDVDAHTNNLVGACLAGMAFAQAGTGIHHRTCHVLGGGWNLPHAETHAVMLPHSTALAAPRAAAAVERVAGLCDADDAPAFLFTLLETLQLPRSLAEIGMPADALEEAAARAAEANAGDAIDPGANAFRRALDDAYAGRPPGSGSRTG